MLEILVKFQLYYSLFRIFFHWCCTGDAYTYTVAASLEKALKVSLDMLERVLYPWLYDFLCALIDRLSDIKDVMSCFELLQLKGSAGSSRQHVHGCSLVRARKFYGYRSFEEFFVKIYLYPDVVYNFLFFLQYVFTCTVAHPAHATCMYKQQWYHV
jgi:hypothetical protein